jgi:CCR4-NOT transcription complex subunit 1
VDLLPEISQAPRILSDVEVAFRGKPLKAEVDEYLKVGRPGWNAHDDLSEVGQLLRWNCETLRVFFRRVL